VKPERRRIAFRIDCKSDASAKAPDMRARVTSEKTAALKGRAGSVSAEQDALNSSA